MKLLIADDEPEVIEGILNLIDFKSNGIDVCGVAYNGEQAIELIKLHQPDIVLIDVKMPKVSGLEAIEIAKKEGFRFEAIILSGYDDFYFAQKAITLKTYNYLLKPCRPEEILNAVLSAKKHLEDELEKKALFEKYRLYFQENLPILKERILNEIVLGIRASKDKIIELSEKYNINLYGNFFRVIIIKIIPSDEMQKNIESIPFEAYKMVVINIIQEYLHTCEFEPNSSFEIFNTNDDIALIISSTEKSDKEYLKNYLKKLADFIFAKTSSYIYFLIGNEVSSLDMLCKSYKEAYFIAELKFFSEDENVLFYDDVYIDSMYLYPLQEEREIITCLALKNKLELDEKIETFFKRLFSQQGNSNKRVIKSVLYSFIGSLIKFCLEKNIEIPSEQIHKIYDIIGKNDKANEIKNGVVSFIRVITESIEKAQNKNYIVSKALEYISQNYSKNITLESVAKEVYVTPAYLSILFKRELGINFLDYLHKYRIEKAQELLSQKGLKTYQVANLVGYQDEKYFSQIFKKYTGLTPSQYKESLFGT